MLDTYLQRTQLLLDDPNFSVYNDGDLTHFINMGRGQLAGQTECCRVLGTLAVSDAVQQYAFSSISLALSATLTVSGIQGVLSVRQASYNVASGQKNVYTRPFPWFQQYVLSNPAPVAGPPVTWSQYGQGSLGTVFVNLLDGAYTLNLDTVCYPSDLADDTTAEAIPYQFTDAIPFYAAYYAAMTKGDMERSKMMFEEYSKFTTRGRGAATPSVLPLQYAQPPDPFVANRLGLQQKGSQQ